AMISPSGVTRFWSGPARAKERSVPIGVLWPWPSQARILLLSPRAAREGRQAVASMPAESTDDQRSGLRSTTHAPPAARSLSHRALARARLLSETRMLYLLAPRRPGRLERRTSGSRSLS